MADGARNTGEGEPRGHWARLEAFLHTDPRDVGCDVTMDLLDVYAELLAAGHDPGERFPGLHAHLLACDACEEDLEGLLAALRDDSSG